MKSVIPFKKQIEFKTRIAEICSISLEHNYKVDDLELKGEFVVSGDYKVHEISVNKESFSYQLPFTIDLSEKVIKDSINFEILDFTYEVVDDDKLNIYIEFSVEADEEEETENIFAEIDARNENRELEELIKQEADLEQKLDISTVEDEDQDQDISGEEEREKIEEQEEIIQDSTSEEEKEILTSTKENTYITYHVHIVKESESIEAIASLYNTSRSVIEEYNDISNLVVGDKLIIPMEADE